MNQSGSLWAETDITVILRRGKDYRLRVRLVSFNAIVNSKYMHVSHLCFVFNINYYLLSFILSLTSYLNITKIEIFKLVLLIVKDEMEIQMYRF